MSSHTNAGEYIWHIPPVALHNIPLVTPCTVTHTCTQHRAFLSPSKVAGSALCLHNKPSSPIFGQDHSHGLHIHLCMKYKHLPYHNIIMKLAPLACCLML